MAWRGIDRIVGVEPREQFVPVNQRGARRDHCPGQNTAAALVFTEDVLGMREVKQLCDSGGDDFGPVFTRIRPYDFAKPRQAVLAVEPELWLSAERFRRLCGTTRHLDNRILRQPYARNPFRSGRSRSRLPVAAKIALAIDGGTGGTPGSPTPAAGASLLIKCTCTVSGASGSRATL